MQLRKPRYKVMDSPVAIFADSIGSIKNISEGGLEATYVSSRKLPKELHMDVSLLQGQFILKKIPVRIIWQGDSKVSPFSKLVTRRAGFQFNNPSPAQQAQLSEFIKDFT